MAIHPFEAQRPRIAKSAWIAPSADVIGDVEIGEESSIWFGTVVRGDVFHIRIGRRTNIQDNSVIHVTTGKNPTILEDEITVGHRAILHGCTIRSRCLIGMGAIVMDKADVGSGSLVGAGALVVEGTIIPPGSLVLGSPARVKRPLTPEEVARIDDAARQYAALAAIYARQL